MYKNLQLSRNHHLAEASIIIPAHNRAGVISEAIKSVLDQTSPQVVPIVVDDGSTDETLSVALSFSDSVTVLSGPNKGVSAARNAGIRAAKSSFIGLLDSDDILEEDFLFHALRSARSSNAVMTFGPWRWSDGNRKVAPTAFRDPASLIKAFNDGYSPATGSILWRKSFIESIGLYNEELSYAEDHEIYFRALSRNPETALFDKSCFVARDVPGLSRLSYPSRTSLLDGLKAANLILNHLLAADLDRMEALKFVKARIYGIMRGAAASSLEDVYLFAEREYKAIGGKGHIGSTAHVLLCSLIGLPQKERMSRFARDLIRSRKEI